MITGGRAVNDYMALHMLELLVGELIRKNAMIYKVEDGIIINGENDGNIGIAQDH